MLEIMCLALLRAGKIPLHPSGGLKKFGRVPRRVGGPMGHQPAATNITPLRGVFSYSPFDLLGGIYYIIGM